MPVPAWNVPEEASPTASITSAPQAADIIILHNNISSFSSARPCLRMGAFAIDFALLYGMSVWVADWISLLMLRYLVLHKQVAHTSSVGVKVSGPFFQESFRYATGLIWPIAFLFLAFAYYVTFLHLWGATIGKGAFGLRVVTRMGKPPSLEKSGKRFLATVFTFFSLGFFFLLGAFSRNGICFHDEASGTRVVRDKHNIASGQEKSSVDEKLFKRAA